MVGRTQRQQQAAFARIVACALMGAAPSLAWAGPPCTEALPDPASAAAGQGANEKFRLVTQLCPAYAAPTRVIRADQLDLYEQRPVAIVFPGAPGPDGTPPVAAPHDTPAPDRATSRVVALAPALNAIARAYEIDPLLLHAIAHVESRHNTRAVSPAGALGVMQVMPATAQRFGVGDPERSLLDTDTNLRAAAAYLRTLRSRYGGDLSLMLAAYNAGEGAVAKHGGSIPPYQETQAYVRDVLAVYRRLGASFTVSASGALVARAGDLP